MVHIMNEDFRSFVSEGELERFQLAMAKMVQCCQEQSQYRCERFGLNDAEQRTLLLFQTDRYLTAKGIAARLNVVRSRVTKILSGLEEKELVKRVPDPEDSRFHLISLTASGQAKVREVTAFLQCMHSEVLARLAPHERQELLDSLQRLQTSMEAVKELLE